MAVDSFSDGTRIAQLPASEVTGHKDVLSVLSVVGSDPDVEPTDDGALAYAVAADDERVAEVYAQSDRVRVELLARPDVITEVTSEVGLRVRPKAVRPPRMFVFVEDGTQVKWTLPVFRVLVATFDAGEREEDEG